MPQRRVRSLLVTVLAGLMLGVGAPLGVFLYDGGSKHGDTGSRAGHDRPVDVPAAFRGSAGGVGGSPVRKVEEERTAASEQDGSPVISRDDPIEGGASSKREAKGQPVASAGSLDVLVLGVDRRPEDAQGAATRSDTMMLVRVIPGTGQIKLLSVPRDLLVEVEPGVEDRINTAYAYGGVERARAVMEGLTGVAVDRHAIVDFAGFEEVVNALGGVTLTVEQTIRVGLEGRRVHIPAGRQELDGLEALAYARYRGTPCGDLDRIRRQQRLISALRGEALGWNTITELPRIVVVANQNVDTDLGIAQAISLGRALVARGGKGGVRSTQLKGEPETLPNGDQVLLPDYRANERILEAFRSDEEEAHRPDRSPRPRGASSGC